MKKTKSNWYVFFQKLLKAGADRRVRMCNLQSAKDCASVKTSLATVHARAQEMGKKEKGRSSLYIQVVSLGQASTDARWLLRFPRCQW